MASPSEAKIILYTNHRCPWAHRAHIALAELGLAHEEVIIDLDVPRPASYLAINARGLVPSLSYDGHIITESAVVAQFLADAHARSRLAPQTGTPDAALRRARMAFFADTYLAKFQNLLLPVYHARTPDEAGPLVDKAVAGLVREVEPLLADAGPFFGGSEGLTMAEVLTASFVIRLLTLLKTDIAPSSLKEALPEKAPSFWKWARAVAEHPSVTGIFNEANFIAQTRARVEKARAAA